MRAFIIQFEIGVAGHNQNFIRHEENCFEFGFEAGTQIDKTDEFHVSTCDDEHLFGLNGKYRTDSKFSPNTIVKLPCN